MLSKNIIKILERNQYKIVGKHSAVQICRWTKKAIRGEDVCWKEKFYGIQSHQCAQITPSLFYCQNKCLHCWRPIEFSLGKGIKNVDEPKKIIGGVVNERKKLLMGFKGNKKINLTRFNESLEPTLFTLSLAGEPTLYPRLAELIQEIRKRKAISFLVTNGLNPERLKELEEKNCLPTQLTISLNAPNEELYKKLCRSSEKDAWEKLNETLKLMKGLKCRTVVRLTLIRNLNMKEKHLRLYAELIKKANPLFVHVKGYVALGYSKKRLGDNRMPFHEEIKSFSEKLAKLIKYKFLDEKIESRVVLLGKSRERMKIKVKEI